MNSLDIERLSKLNELRSAGALSDAEFEREKAKLLSSGSSRMPIYAGAGAITAVVAALVGVWVIPRDPPMEGVEHSPALVSAPSSPTPSPPPPTRTSAERLRQAFEAATGHSRPFVQTLKGESFTVSPVDIVELPFGPALLAKREMKDGCHACSGYLAVYYLRENDEQTVVTASYPEAISGWGWGAAPTEWQITTRFTSNPAVYASGGYMGQGIVESSAVITELRPEGPVSSDLIGTGFSNAGALTDDDPRPRCEVDGKIANVVKDRSFDVVVTGSVSGRDRYVKRGAKFVVVNKREWGTPCSTGG